MVETYGLSDPKREEMLEESPRQAHYRMYFIVVINSFILEGYADVFTLIGDCVRLSSRLSLHT